MYRFEPPPSPSSRAEGGPDTPHATALSDGAPDVVDPHLHHPGMPPAPQAPPWDMPGVYNHPRATTALTLGILSAAVLPILGPLAWWIADGALREVDATPQIAANRSTLAAARILGIIGTCFAALGALCLLLIVATVLGWS